MRILSRLGQMLLVLVAVSAATFVIGRLLPGDLATSVLGPKATAEQLAALRHQLGLDQSIPRQFLTWISGVAHGDLGTSPISGIPVSDSILQRLPVSVELMLLAELLALGIAIPLAVLAARRTSGWTDRAARGVSFVLLATPQFGVGILLILVFAVGLGWFPATGYVFPGDDPVGNLRSLLLPAATLAAGLGARSFRVLRAGLSDTLRQDFVQLARAEGLPTRTIMFRHALRPSLLPLLTVVGLDFGLLIGGALIVEELFAIPGLGTFAMDSILARDTIQLQGVVLTIALIYVVINTLVDLLYSVLDPRIRYGQ